MKGEEEDRLLDQARHRCGKRMLFLLMLGLALAGCDAAEAPAQAEPPSINGAWQGQVVDEGAGAAAVRLELATGETRGALVGTGTILLAAETLSCQVRGTYVHPTLNIELQVPDRRPGQLSGLVSEARDGIDATIQGPGFSGSIMLARP